MKQISTKNAKVIRICNKSVIFQLEDRTEAYATKRVANEILSNNEEIPVFIEEYCNDFIKTNWLLTPSRF